MGDTGFALAMLGGLAALVIFSLVLARMYPGVGEDLLDWQPTRSLEAEIENELDDLDQMLEAQNERRRCRGAPERTLEQVELDVAADLAEQHALRRRHLLRQEDGAEAVADAEGLRRALAERRASAA